MVKESRDDKFTFKIMDDKLIEISEAYKVINIPKREYERTQKTFKYNLGAMLTIIDRYEDSNEFIDHRTQCYIIDEGTPHEEVYELIGSIPRQLKRYLK